MLSIQYFPCEITNAALFYLREFHFTAENCEKSTWFAQYTELSCDLYEIQRIKLGKWKALDRMHMELSLRFQSKQAASEKIPTSTIVEERVC